jgi:hypothetical protein
MLAEKNNVALVGPDIEPGLIEADQCVTALRRSLSHGETDLKDIPELVKTVLEHEMWRRRYVIQRQKEVAFDSFAAFAAHPPPEGLGSSIGAIQRFCNRAGDLKAVDLIDRNEDRPRGRPGKNVNNVHIFPRPEGNTTARSLRRLRTQRQDLHARVLAGELTPAKAMREAGFRMQTHTIPHDARRAASALLRQFTGAEIREIIQYLQEGNP